MKRYVAAMIRDAKTEEGLTEENFKVVRSQLPKFYFSLLCYLCCCLISGSQQFTGAEAGYFQLPL